jgi:hypothetical protein
VSDSHKIGEPSDPLAAYRDKQRLDEMLAKLREAVDEHGRCRANYKRLRSETPLGYMNTVEECKLRSAWSRAEQDLIRAAYAVFGRDYASG